MAYMCWSGRWRLLCLAFGWGVSVPSAGLVVDTVASWCAVMDVALLEGVVSVGFRWIPLGSYVGSFGFCGWFRQFLRLIPLVRP